MDRKSGAVGGATTAVGTAAEDSTRETVKIFGAARQVERSAVQKSAHGAAEVGGPIRYFCRLGCTRRHVLDRSQTADNTIPSIERSLSRIVAEHNKIKNDDRSRGD